MLAGVDAADAAAQGASMSLGGLFGLFNVVAGLMLTAGLLMFFGGFVAYLTRLGLEGRSDGLRYMSWGVTVLFVLIILLAIVHYIQFNPTIVYWIFGFLALCFLTWAILTTMRESAAHKEDE